MKETGVSTVARTSIFYYCCFELISKKRKEYCFSFILKTNSRKILQKKKLNVKERKTKDTYNNIINTDETKQNKTKQNKTKRNKQEHIE